MAQTDKAVRLLSTFAELPNNVQDWALGVMTGAALAVRAERSEDSDNKGD